MSILGLLASIFISQVFAIDVSYPIPELGNCGNVDECAAYCDLPVNYTACTRWAAEKGPSEQEVLDDLSITFPIPELGNCTDTVACMNYCDQPANAQACLRWAEKHGVTGDEEVAAKMEGITFPIAELGNCGGPSACADFCSQAANMQTCTDFSIAKGWGGGPPPGMGGIEGPGGCSSQQECDAYCSRRENKEECTRWAEKHGMKHGGPGGCTTEAECRAYCEQNPDNEDCTRGREEWCATNPDDCWNPGGCRTEAECRAYCEANQDDPECHKGRDEWCRDHPDECREGGPGGGDSPCHSNEDCQRYCQENPDSDYCRQADENWCREHPEECAAKDQQRGPEGPGGYPEECGGMDCAEFCRLNPDAEYCVRMDADFCQRNPDQCAPPGGEEGPPGGGGPGGCQTPEECSAYCSANPTDPACQAGPPQ